MMSLQININQQLSYPYSPDRMTLSIRVKTDDPSRITCVEKFVHISEVKSCLELIMEQATLEIAEFIKQEDKKDSLKRALTLPQFVTAIEKHYNDGH